jgi:uncharacterized protein (TIGR03435 family)
MPRCLLILIVVLAIVFAAIHLAAQTPPAFEVATVRPSEGPIPGIPFNLGQQRTTADTLIARNSALREIIQRAYGIGPQQLEGPTWLNEVKLDLVGKSARPATDAQLWEMVRPLLEERFHLKFHYETREVSGLAMVIGKKGHKLKVSEGGSNNLAMDAGVFRGSNVTLGRLAGLLSAVLRRPVRDETGLEGTYDFVINTRAYAGQGGPQDLASLTITAFREDLGLQLESRKFDIQVMVIDHMERTPDEN